MAMQVAEAGALLNAEREFMLRHVHMNQPLVRGEGVHLYDEAGTRYTDFLSQYGATPFGQNPEFLWDRLEQVRARRQPSLVQPLFAEAPLALARKLVEVMPFGFRHVTLANSGAETVEAAFKLAKARTGRRRIVSLSCAFHGKTHAAVLATGNPRYREPFGIRSDDFVKVEPEDAGALEEVLGRGDVAGLILEPVIGEGGMLPLSDEYLRRAQELCRQHGTLFIVDEIQTGLFRTGKWLACAGIEGVEPDIVCLAKALGGGLMPIGAVLASARAWTEEFGLLHSSTFANNQLASSVATAVLEHLAEHEARIVEHVGAIGLLLARGLDDLVERYPDVYAAHTGRGLMRGLRVRPIDGHDSYFIAHACGAGTLVPLLCGYLFHRHHFVCAPLFSQKSVIRLEPPLVIERESVDGMLRALEECAILLRQRRYATLLSYLVERTPEELAYSERNHRPVSVVTELGAPATTERRLGCFAFLIHPPGEDDLISMMPEAIENLEGTHREEMLEWMRSWFTKRWEPSPVFHVKRLRSKAGGYVEGWLIASPLTSRQMLRLSRADRKLLMDGFVGTAREVGADIMGLGAFTSVITRAGRDIDTSLIHVTTGNSLTAMSVAASVKEALGWMNRDDPGLTVGIVGAAGSVGRLAAIQLSESYARIVLVGNPDNTRAVDKLHGISGEIYAHALIRLQQGMHTGLAGFFHGKLRNIFVVLNACNQELFGGGEPDYLRIKRITEENLSGPSPVHVSVAPAESLPACHGVVSATSHGGAFIRPAWLRPGAVVADAARPADLQDSVRRDRPDVLAYEGGLVRLPEPFAFGRANVLGFHPSINLGCLSETIVLAMSGVERSYSLGDRIPHEEAFRINKLAQIHGFTPCIATKRGELELERHEGVSALEERA